MGQHEAAVRMPRRASLHPRGAGQGVLALVAGFGLFLLLLGAALDLGHHAGMPGLAAEPLGVTGHLVTLAGMVLTGAAVALFAALRRR